MKGFKDSSKIMQGHDHSPLCRATGGIVAPLAGGMGARMGLPSIRPIMPRPRVMPTVKVATMRGRKLFARGGPVDCGNTLEQRGGGHAYSEMAKEFPDNVELRPGYKKGGIHIKKSHKGLFTKKMTGSKSGHLTGADVARGLHSKNSKTRKQANFARMARRGFKPLCGGGQPGYAQGGGVRAIAKQEINKHVATAPPRGHGVKSGNLAFMSKPMFGED